MILMWFVIKRDEIKSIYTWIENVWYWLKFLKLNW